MNLRFTSRRICGVLIFILVLMGPLYSSMAKVRQISNPVGVLQQKVTVKGMVKDESGDGIPGVSVVVKGTTHGTITDVFGSYSLQTEKGAVLQFSFVGLISEEITVGSQELIDVTMRASVEELEEVVVVGYGVQKKKSIVGAISQTPSKELLQSGGATDMTNSLTGRVPGMSVMEKSAQPGEANTEILIRGKSSWNDNSPLVLVDGIERNFNDIDPNEVESISILKDASATAVFGVKGANGVILVTSKQGGNEAPKVTVSTEVGMKKPTNNYNRLDVPSLFRLGNEALANDGLYNMMIPESTIRKWEDPNRDIYRYPNVNWFDEMVGTGYQSRTNLNISGGSEKVKYFASIGHIFEGDVFNTSAQEEYDPRFNNERINFRTNLDFKISKTTNFRVGVSGNQRSWARPASMDRDWSAGEFFKDIYRTPSYEFPVRFPMGYAGGGSWEGQYGGSASIENPVVKMNGSGAIENRRTELFTNLKLDQDLSFITEGLSVRGQLAFDTYNTFTRTTSKTVEKYAYLDLFGNDTEQVFPQQADPNFVEKPANVGHWGYNYYRKTLFYELSGRYNRTYGDHSVGGLLLFSRRINEPNTSFPFYEENWAGRVTYDYKMKYLAEVNAGVNGSDNFAPGQRFGFFPAFALGWVLTEENWMKNNLRWLNHFKVRYSYGTVGRSHINANTRHLYFGEYYTQNNLNWRLGNPPAGWGPHYFEGRMPNESATWEKAVKQNLGFEMTMFKNFNINLDLFNEYRYDILMERRNLPVWSGFTGNPYANIGEVKSRGFEVVVNYKVEVNKDLQINIAPNFSFNQSRVIERDDPFFTPDYQKEAGKPIGWNKGYITDGIYNNWDDIYNSPNTNLGSPARPGDIKYVDFNASGMVDTNDQTAVEGLTFPTKTYGLNLGVDYKNFNFSALFYGVTDIYANINSDLLFGMPYGYFNFDQTHLERWTPDGSTSASLPALRYQYNNHNDRNTVYKRRNASFLRLQNVEAGYNIVPKHIKGISRIYIYVSGNNLFTITDFDDRIDPANSNSAYPLVKRYNLGVRFTIK